MKRFSEQFKKQSESIHLRASERNALKERVFSYMEYHPLPKDLAQPKAHKGAEVIVSEPFMAFRLNPLFIRSFAGVFSVFLILGVPVIAEKSVPGDVLYPVKIQFNEELRSSLSLSPYAKVAWETERLERRISEARLLASEGKLTEAAEIKVAQAVKNHTEAAQREIAQMRENDSDEAAIAEIAFASALAVQTEVLESHMEKDLLTSQQMNTGRSVVALAQAVAQARITAEASQSGVQPSYDKLLGRVEEQSTHIYELFAQVRKDASEEEMAHVERRLADIERKIAKAVSIKEGETQEDETSSMMLSTMQQPADASFTATSSEEAVTDAGTLLDEPEVVLEADSQAEAVAVLRTALTDIQKLINYMTHIDVRKNVALEDLVPLTLTDEEQISEIMTLLDKTVALQSEIANREVSQKLREKVTFGQEELEIKLSASVAAMEQGKFEEASTLLEEAFLLASDLEDMTNKAPQRTAPEVATTTVETGETPEEAQ